MYDIKVCMQVKSLKLDEEKTDDILLTPKTFNKNLEQLLTGDIIYQYQNQLNSLGQYLTESWIVDRELNEHAAMHVF